MNVLFVCSGNTCRSPMALAAAKKIITADLKYIGLSFDSAGTNAAEGEPAAEYAVRVMRETGAELDSHRSKRFSQKVSQWADIIFAMEKRHIEYMAAAAPQHRRKMFVLSEYALTGGGIPDPYGGDENAYRTARDSIISGVDKALKRLAAEYKL